MNITYWAPGVPDGYGGVTYGAPLALKGRWEDKQEEYLNAKLEEELSNAIVFFPSSVNIQNDGGYLYNGASVATDPTKVANAFRIAQVLKTPDLRNVKMELRVVL